jgi:hypothetical protein
MVGKNYFDLTIGNDICCLIIQKKNNFDCQIIDDRNGEVYDGFKIAQSRKGNIFTVCDINFHKSNTDQKYKARLVFRRTDNNFKGRNVNKGSDCVRISFERGEDGYREFWKMIVFLYRWRETINLDEFDDYFTITDKSLAYVLPEIANLKNKKTVLGSLKNLSRDDLQNIGNWVNTTKFKNIIDEWEKNKNNDQENYWQNLFKENNYILSQIFACPHLKIGEKFYCGGKNEDDKGGVKGDLLYKSLTNNLALIEIKTPRRDIIIGKKYRGEKGKENIIYSMNENITGGVNQILNQKKVYLKTHGEKNDRFFNNPKCVLIIGILPTDEDEKKSFELYRNSLRDVEIITYDELFEKIKLILEIFEK